MHFSSHPEQNHARGSKAQGMQEVTMAVLHCTSHPHHSSAYPLPTRPARAAAFSPETKLTELLFHK